jgi:uncharacterized protein YciI
MLFAFIAHDKPGHLQVRLDTRPEHVSFLNGLGKTLKFAGPFLDGEGKPNGSMGVIEADDIASARAILARDPYAAAGLFESVDVRPWNWTFHKPAEA